METQPQQEPARQEVFISPEIVSVIPQVQIALAKQAFPDLDARSALKKWIDDPDKPDTLAATFRKYIEDPAHVHDHINLSEPSEVAALLKSIQEYKETLH